MPPNEGPVHKFVHEVPRISCNLSREEFVEEVVRKRKAVILSGCQSQYQWLDDMDLSLEAATKVSSSFVTCHQTVMPKVLKDGTQYDMMHSVLVQRLGQENMQPW